MHSCSSVSPVVALRAQQHRSALTESEQLLWSLVSNCQLGVWFRRQVPVGTFIVDFLAPGTRLVIEVDGSWHHSRRAADARRDAKLVRMGYRVLRLDARFVMRAPHAAVARIREAIAASKHELPEG